MPRQRAKRWCFTLNNPTEEENGLLLLYVQQLNSETPGGLSNPKLTYLVFGKEAVSTPHLQGYLETKTKTSLSSMKKFLKRAHWEKAKGSPKQASDYCKKDGDYEEGGDLSPGQGHRSDLVEIKKKIDEGASELEIADQHFAKWVVYRRSFQAYSTLIASKRNFMTKTHVYWGKTGTGKTRFCYNQVMDEECWSPGDYKWFDGYRGQPIVILDDFRGEYKLQMLLKLLDRYPLQVPIKGGFTEWKPRKVYITSNIHPNDWYPLADRYSLSAMFRRFSLVQACFNSIY
jgi:hypothetical protein